MRTSFLVVVLCCIYTPNIGCETKMNQDNNLTSGNYYNGQSYYHVILSGDNSGSSYDDDEYINLGHAGKETAVIFVNDSPVIIVGNGGELFCIDDFVLPGRNEVRVEGIRGETSFLKVALIDPDTIVRREGKFTEVVAKCRLDHNAKTNTLEFYAPDTLEPASYEEFAQDEQAQKELDENIESFLASEEKYFREMDWHSLLDLKFDILQLGKTHQPSRILEVEYDRRLLEVQDNKANCDSYELEIIESDYDRSKIDIYKGRRSVLICRNIPEGEGWVHPTPYFICKIRNQDGEITQSGSRMTLLIKVNGVLYSIGR